MKKNSTLLNYFSIAFFILMTFFLSQKCYSQDEHKIDSLKTLLKTSKEDTVRVKMLIKISQIYRSLNLDSGIVYAGKAIHLANKLKYKPGEIRAKQESGLLEYYSGNYKGAERNYTEALRLSRESNDELAIANTFLMLGAIYNGMGNFPLAVQIYDSCLYYYKKCNNKVGEAKCLVNTGVMYWRRDNNKALQYYNRALDLNSPSIIDTDAYVNATTNIANIISESGQKEKAIKYFLTAQKILEKKGE